MDANRDKISISLSVQDNVVILSDHIRVLGITLDDSLKFDLHVSLSGFLYTGQITRSSSY